MKKALISLGALVFTGALLASCSTSSASSIKKPNKGKKVNEVTFKAYNEDYDLTNFSIKSSDSFDDVMKELVEIPRLYSTLIDEDDKEEFAFTSKNDYKSSITATNYYVPYSENILYEKYFASSETISSDDIYFQTLYNSSGEESTVYEKTYTKTTETTKRNKYSETNSSTIEGGRAGKTTYSASSISERSVDGGRYRLENNKSTSNKIEGKESGSKSSKDYEYLNGTEKSTDDNYGKTYKGYDDSGNVYSYTYSTFLSSNFLSSYKTKQSSVMPSSAVYLSNYYNEDFKDLFKGSFELTDKYIVIKFDTTYLLNVYSEAVLDAEDDAQVKSNYDKLIKGDYKGSKGSYELWIDYVTDVSDSGTTYLSYGYAKADTKIKINRKTTYDDDYINDYHISESDAAIIKGKQYTIKGYITEYMEIAVNSNDYSKKIDSMKKLCKKNNVLDKITMSVYDTGLF